MKLEKRASTNFNWFWKVRKNMQKGYSDVLVGIQYGDEGKAKVIDLLAEHYDTIVRFNGGMNAGHTLYVNGEKLALRQLPSGVLHDHCSVYIGSGCVLNLVELVNEIKKVEALGISLKDRLKISAKAVIIQPHHVALDKKYGGHIGTTKNGIGPCYADRAIRALNDKVLPVRMRDIIQNTDKTVQNIRENSLAISEVESLEISQEELQKYCSELKEALEIIRPYVTTDMLYLYNKVKNGERVLFEGAQSINLDVVHGDIPFVTSSHTIPAYAYVGGDLPISCHRKTIGVAKAIESRVGNGPFPGEFGGSESEQYCENAMETGITKQMEFERYKVEELFSSGSEFDMGMAIRMLTDEYGSGTGRPRRIGMLDIYTLKKVVQSFGIDWLFLNKCDVLNIFENTDEKKIPVLDIDSNGDPVKRYFDCFGEIESVDSEMDNLPEKLTCFLRYVEDALEIKLLGIGLGQCREKNIMKSDLLKD